ncbi:MAG: hypothetical protein KJN63_11505, partial [Acidimicrobiia bacterium]|nr:hypothetical protein [Acidimicrobiia bacterium]
VHSMEPLGEGSVSRFTIWAGPIPLRWEATHRNVTEAGFTDVQTDGPMARWEHTHTFRPLNLETTEVQEHIEYQHAGGFWGVVTRVFFAPPALKALFAYRRFQTVRHCKRRRLETDS